MPRIIEEHRQLVDIKMQELQDSLAARIKKFVDDLNIYAKMVDELQYNGNIEELPKYHKRATQLDNRFKRMDNFNISLFSISNFV